VTIVATNAALGLIGTVGWQAGLSERTLFIAFFVIGLTYLALFLYPGRFMRWARRDRRKEAA
jgi:hypothetical protein